MPSLRNSSFLDLLFRGGAPAYLQSFEATAAGDPTLAPRSDARRAELRRRLRLLGQDTAYLLLATASWLLVNLLAVFGFVVAIFLVIAGFDLPTFFLHLDNLTSRYVAADLGRRAAFEHQIAQAFVALLLLSLLVRGPLFITTLRRELRRQRGQGREGFDAA